VPQDDKAYSKSRIFGGTVASYLAVKRSADKTVVVAAAASDVVYGLTGDLGGVSGQREDVTIFGPAKWKAGGTVYMGDKLVSDAAGKCVAVTRHVHTETGSTTAAGTTVSVVAIAQEDGVSGDTIEVFVLPSLG
jgi:hypothetical protein